MLWDHNSMTDQLQWWSLNNINYEEITVYNCNYILRRFLQYDFNFGGLDIQVQAFDHELVSADFLSKMEDVSVLHLP